MKTNYLLSQIISIPIDFILCIIIFPIAYLPYMYMNLTEGASGLWALLGMVTVILGLYFLHDLTKKVVDDSMSGWLFVIAFLFVFLYLNDFIKDIIPPSKISNIYIIYRYITSSVIFLITKFVLESFLYFGDSEFHFKKINYIKEKLNID